jgi:hypothetical protein
MQQCAEGFNSGVKGLSYILLLPCLPNTPSHVRVPSSSSMCLRVIPPILGVGLTSSLSITLRLVKILFASSGTVVYALLPVAAESRIRSEASSCGIFGQQYNRDTGTPLFTWFCRCQIRSFSTMFNMSCRISWTVCNVSS